MLELNQPTLFPSTAILHRGELIVLAREELGLNQAEFAAQLGIHQGTLSKLESGLISLSPEVEESLIKVTARPSEFFRYAGPLEAPTFVLYRKKASITPAQQKMFWAKITLASLHIRRLLSGTELITTQLPYCDPDECKGGVIEIAQRIRRMWKLPPGPIKKLIPLVENAGCLIVVIDFDTRKIDGCSGFIDNVPVIFINANLPAARQKLTIAHELGHLIMHRFPCEDAEDQAFLFAAELLMPGDEITPMLRPLSFDRLAKLKLHWGCSMQALIKRAEGLGVISASNARYYWAKLNQSGYRENEPYDNELVPETPTLMLEMMDTYTNELKYSADDLAKLMLMPATELLTAYRGIGNHLRIVK